MHISIAEDVSSVLSALGHQVERQSLSGHRWVNGVPGATLKGISRGNWTSVGPDLVKKFHRLNRRYLESFDGFLVSYPPAFALLFEPLGKPVVLVTCTRFDFPTFPANYGWLLEGLRRMSNNGQLLSIANNLLDKWFNDNILGVETTHISSLCAYLPQANFETERPRNFLPWTRYPHSLSHPFLDTDFSISRKYDRRVIAQNAGVVHIPYNLSIMSAFEHYWQGIPMYFPSESLQRNWFVESPSQALQEVLFPSTALKFSEDLIGLADWYDSTNFKGVRIFESEAELYGMLEDDDLSATSSEMLEHNLLRKAQIHESWARVIQEL